MIQSLAGATALVSSYDKGLAFFCGAFGFAVLEGARLRGRTAVCAAGRRGAQILAVAGEEFERARIGDQTGGRLGYFLFGDDFRADCQAVGVREIELLEKRRAEAYGQVVVFVDTWGDKWGLPRPATNDVGPSL